MATKKTKKREKIVFVDGFKIRNTLDLEFDMFHKKSIDISPKYGYTPKYYIPADETWIDYRYKKEKDFLLASNKFFFKDHYDIPYLEARALAKKELCKSGIIPVFVQRQEKRGSLQILYVNGFVVRNYIDPEFSFGGHEFVYDYVPKNEVWLDNLMDPHELKYVLAHELRERDLMSQGEIYDSAHEVACAFERKQRRDDGIGFYPGDVNYPWSKWPTKKIIKQYYVAR